MVASESSNEVGSGERRKRQRFVARRWGSVCFWVVIDGERLPVNDLSLEGFSVPYGAPLIEPRQLGFELSLDGIPERIFGVAETMNFTVGESGGQLGCRFLSFEGEAGRDKSGPNSEINGELRNYHRRNKLALNEQGRCLAPFVLLRLIPNRQPR